MLAHDAYVQDRKHARPPALPAPKPAADSGAPAEHAAMDHVTVEHVDH
jgi:hypothetical protein